MLGVVRGANGQYGGYNIYPADDQDWFAVDLVAGATLTVDVLTESLASPPPNAATAVQAAAPSVLDPFVEIYDPFLTIIAFNDDVDPGIILESRVTDVPIPADGRYYIRVTSFNGLSVGHYELLINVKALLGSAHTAGGPASLYSIDPTTGVGTLIGAIGFNRVGAMTVHPTTGVYYAAAQRSLDATPVLITLDPTTGGGTEVGPTGVSGSVSDMSFHSDGTLYGHDATPGSHGLYTFDLLTGAATQVGFTDIGGQGNAMWFDPSDVLYIATTEVSTTSLYSVSTLTASPTFVGTFTYTGAVCTSPVTNAADYDPLSGTTYASVRCFDGPSTTSFASVDVGTLTVNVIGPTVDRIDGVVNRRR